MAGPCEEGKDPRPQRCHEPPLQRAPTASDGFTGSSAGVAGPVWGLGEGSKGRLCVGVCVHTTASVSPRVSRRLMGCGLPAHRREPCPAQLRGEAAEDASDVGPQQVLVWRPHALRWWMIYEEGSDSLTSAPAGLSGRFWSFYLISKSPDCPSP